MTGADGKRRSPRGSSAAATLPRRTKKTTAPAGPVEPRVDEAVTQGTSLSFSVVGVGASAGGLEAFTQLLRALPVDTGMAFVLVQHLAPTHESALADILSRATSMPVTEVANEPKLEPNRVYVIPPGKEMIISRGHLQLLPRQASGKQHPIDHFFRSLAASQRQLAIGVVLSGTATDGTLGVEEIHAEGGITFAQDETAVQRGMPQSAIASGCVDFVLPPEAIAAEIARIGAHPLVTGNHRDPPPGGADRHRTQGQESLAPILHFLRNATGVDFTEYKTNTLLRRVRRRMVLQKRVKLSDYAELLRESSVEVRALYDDVLINVTRFFREPEVFVEVKKKVIPALLRDRSGRDPIRFWVVGCSTGEEAYSLAILLMEALESSNSRTVAQVFATDLNAAGIDQARAGVYSKERLENVSRERLRRFFVEVDGKYRVTKAIREMCVFSRHNVMADPPFSRMDLVSCRNLLIYLEPSLQQRILPVLHYALKPTGFLVLGASETVGKFSDLFESGQSKHRIYTKKPGTSRTFLSSVQGRRTEALDPGTKRPRSLLARAKEAGPLPALAGTDFHKEAERLLVSFAPPSVLVDGNMQILQFRGNTEPYLAPAQGKASFALLKMAREGLLVPLQALLQRAKKEGKSVQAEGLRVSSGAGYRAVDLQVLPITGRTPRTGCFLVLFKDARPAGGAGVPVGGGAARSKATDGGPSRASSRADVAHLEHELASTRHHLQVVMEAYETAHEELQSSNEEAQSANEELQSINEELETSKEEIQSSNEELSTVNDELNHRNLEVGHLNNDLTNLIGSAQLAIVMVGLDLRIRRFSPMAEKLLNLIPADVGRPITDIRMNLALPDLDKLLEEVIDTVRPQEAQIQDKHGRWWSLRMRPYLTSEKKIDGAVLMLMDIDALKVSEQAIAAARDYLRKWEHMFNHAGWAVATMRPETDVLELVNPAFAKMHGYSVEELIGRPLSDILSPEGRGNGSSQPRDGDEQSVLEYESLHVHKDGTVFPVLTHISALKDDDGHVLYRAATFQDITERSRQEAARRVRSDELAAADRAKNHFIAVLSHELRSPLNVIYLWSEILHRPETSARDRRRGLQIISRSCKSQSQLIEDLMDLHRITSGTVRLALAQVDLREITLLVVESMAPTAAEKGIRIDCQGIDPSPLVVAGDSARLQQVLRNLIGNALKFSEKEGKVGITLRRRIAHAELIVSDSGQGISAEVLPHVFEPFQALNPGRVTTHGGLGLGLSIVKNLVDVHGGQILGSSPGPGKGATFTVRLPLLVSGEVHPPALALTSGSQESVSLEGISVLVVDDDREAREPLRRLLEQAGAEATEAASVDEALEFIRQRPPDVIVSDISMPGRDGYDLLRSVRALPAERGGQVPAIALTAHGTAEDRAQAHQVGFQMHLAKPVESSELIATLAAIVARKVGAP